MNRNNHHSLREAFVNAVARDRLARVAFKKKSGPTPDSLDLLWSHIKPVPLEEQDRSTEPSTRLSQTRCPRCSRQRQRVQHETRTLYGLPSSGRCSAVCNFTAVHNFSVAEIWREKESGINGIGRSCFATFFPILSPVGYSGTYATCINMTLVNDSDVFLIYMGSRSKVGR